MRDEKEKKEKRNLSSISDWDMEKISRNLIQCRNYGWILRLCSWCDTIFISHTEREDPQSLFMFKCNDELAKKIFYQSLHHLNNVNPPVPRNVLREYGLEDFSGSICILCYACSKKGDLIRKSQIKEGYSACFGSAVDSCVHEDCKYYRECVVPFNRYAMWFKRVLYLKEEGIFKCDIFPRR